MRGIKAKHLRRIARSGSTGNPAWHMIASKTNLTTHFLHPQCTRGLYQDLKKHPWRFKRLPNGERMLVPLTFNKHNQPKWNPKDENPLSQPVAS